MLMALDTSTSQTGLALFDGNRILGEMNWRSHLRQTIELAPAITDMLNRVDITMQAVRAIGVAVGPGSFTSLRVGLSLAKGLAMAGHIPIIGIPSLDVLVASLPVQELPLAAVLQAGRGRLAVGWYHASQQGWLKDGAAIVQTADELADSITSPTIVCGELDEEERQRLHRKYRNIILPSPARCVRRPGLLAEIAWQRWQAGDVDNPASLAPIYLHVAGGIPA